MVSGGAAQKKRSTGGLSMAINARTNEEYVFVFFFSGLK